MVILVDILYGLIDPRNEVRKMTSLSPLDFERISDETVKENISRPSLSYWADAWIRLKANKEHFFFVLDTVTFGIYDSWSANLECRSGLSKILIELVSLQAQIVWLSSSMTMSHGQVSPTRPDQGFVLQKAPTPWLSVWFGMPYPTRPGIGFTEISFQLALSELLEFLWLNVLIIQHFP